MDHFILQKEILNKLNTIVVLSDEINEELSKKLIAKSRAIRVELTNDLKQKCAHFLTEPIDRELYACKVCGEKFDDGRKLGGHVSRAHKDKKSKGVIVRTSKKSRKQSKKEKEHESSDEDDGAKLLTVPKQ